MPAAAAGGSGQPAAAEAHDPVPGLNIFADPDADALAAVLGRGFSAADWPHVWALRAVSRGCHAAVCSDEVWRQLFGGAPTHPGWGQAVGGLAGLLGRTLQRATSWIWPC